MRFINHDTVRPWQLEEMGCLYPYNYINGWQKEDNFSV